MTMMLNNINKSDYSNNSNQILPQTTILIAGSRNSTTSTSTNSSQTSSGFESAKVYMYLYVINNLLLKNFLFCGCRNYLILIKY